MLLIGIKKRGMEMASFNPQDGMSGAPSKKSGGSKTILIILAILGVLGLVCCGSVGGLAWFGASKLNEIASQELRRRLDESPVAAAELGTIESLSINLMNCIAQRNRLRFATQQPWVRISTLLKF